MRPRTRRRLGRAASCALVASAACSSASQRPVPAAPVSVEASFVEVPARDVTLKGNPVHLTATARLFYNLQPAAQSPDSAPIFFLFNGFAAEVVRAFGTGPMTVADGGAVVQNPTPYTAFANVVYLEPRQAGYSYDVAAPGGPSAADCSPDVFNEYVDAADVLMGALAFLEAHPQMRGPVYWVGESYAGVRITWILAYLRGRWDLAAYADPTLAAAIARSSRGAALHAGQALLEGWVAGGAHTAAIAAECTDPVLAAAVAADVGVSCGAGGACACAQANDRSPYNYTFTIEHETARETEASAAHVDPDKAAALLDVRLETIPRLAGAERAKGFKCSTPDATLPPEDALAAALGPLPAGQAYYVNYSPLLPGKETAQTVRDWQTQSFEGQAFADNVHDVPTFLTAGPRDLVVPPRALAPALRSILGDARVDDTSPARLGLQYPDGERFADRFEYADAGHMVEMVAASALAADLQAWVARTNSAPP